MTRSHGPLSQTGAAMKALYRSLLAATLVVAGTVSSTFTTLCAQEATALAPHAAIGVMEDLSGPELKQRHGINQLSLDELTLLLDAALDSRRTVELWHDIVDEDAADSVASLIKLEPFSSAPPVPIMLRGTLAAMKRQKADWDALQAAYLQDFVGYRNSLIKSLETFSAGVLQKQVDTTATFNKWLEMHPGKDYNRSDVAGTFLGMVKTLAASPAAVKVIIINSDCNDLPRYRSPRDHAFTEQELSAGIQLIFVNTSRLPEKEPLFHGITNAVHHADNLRAAIELVGAWVKQPEKAVAKAK
jgi:hypothetical protein